MGKKNTQMEVDLFEIRRLKIYDLNDSVKH